jgi:hypothetical protein
MPESVVGQWTGSTPLKKAKCIIVVYAIGEFISSQLPGRPHSPLWGCHTLSAGRPGHVSKWRDAELLDILSRQWDVHILIPFRR